MEEIIPRHKNGMVALKTGFLLNMFFSLKMLIGK